MPSPEGSSPAHPRARGILGLAIGLAVAVLVILLLGFGTLTQQQAAAARWIDHTLEVLAAVEKFEGDLATCISEGRGLVILQDPETLAAFGRSLETVPADIAALRALTADNPRQQAALRALEAPVALRLGRLQALVTRTAREAPRPGLTQAAERRQSNALMAQIGSAADDLKTEERRLLITRRDEAHGTSVRLWLAMLCVGLASAATVAFALFVQAARTRQQAHLHEQAQLNEKLERLTRHLIKARDTAEQASRAKTHFLAGMSHELRTPLNGIMGYARLLRMDGGLTGTQAARVDAMIGAGKHLLQMIARVLDLSEIESEHVELATSTVDAQALAAACLDLMRPAAGEKDLALSMSVLPDTPLCIAADQTRLQQILLNLLGNAVKFTAHGAVELRLAPAAGGTGLLISVTDTGPGVPAGQRSRLFQDFERLDTAASRAAEGAGLGLSLSARLAALMGGRMGYDERAGGGSVFWLELPFAAVPAEPSPAADTPHAGMPALAVLVVDDIYMNRDIAGSFLRAAGHHVTCVDGGAQAVEAVASARFDVVLMDVRMPEMDGLEATRRIRAREAGGRRVPILALTAQAFTEQIADCRMAGMDGHLLKPFDSEALLAAVRHAASAEALPDPPPGAAAPPPAPSMPLLPPNLAPGADLPVFDAAAFERTASFLPAEKVLAYVRAVAAGSDALLGRLGVADAGESGGTLAEAAHALAGSAGMLGFMRLASLGRRFEHALQTGGADLPILRQGLADTLQATSRAIADGSVKVPAASSAMA